MTPPCLLVAIDFSQSSHAALAWALRHAEGRPHALHLVHVVEDLPGMTSARERAEADAELICASAVAELAKLAPGKGSPEAPVVHVRRGHPVRTILACATELGAELLVVGSHGHTGLERMLVGSVAERLVRLSECPVVVVKQPRRA